MNHAKWKAQLHAWIHIQDTNDQCTENLDMVTWRHPSCIGINHSEWSEQTTYIIASAVEPISLQGICVLQETKISPAGMLYVWLFH